jgi:hypothetical protein
LSLNKARTCPTIRPLSGRARRSAGVIGFMMQQRSARG